MRGASQRRADESFFRRWLHPLRRARASSGPNKDDKRYGNRPDRIRVSVHLLDTLAGVPRHSPAGDDGIVKRQCRSSRTSGAPLPASPMAGRYQEL